MNRRMFLGSSAGLCLAAALGESQAALQSPALIVLWLNGGPSHVDSFDPKKTSSFRSIATRVPALRLSEHLPQLAEQAHRITVVRSMTSKEGNHDRARHLAHTGYSPNPTVAHPALGAWVSHARKDGGALPAFVSIGGPSAGPGFLGVAHAPFVLRSAGEPPDNLAPRIDADRFARRKAALAFLESRFDEHAAVKARRQVFESADKLMHAPENAAFDVSSESAALIKTYGDSAFGRGCLAARRLVQAGVRVVEVSLDGWDTHENNDERTRTLLGTLDPAMSALIADLAERAMLDHTMVMCLGEFGRTPRKNGRDGRDHYPRAFSAVLAGGGLAGGTVLGATDDEGATVVERPITLPDLLATALARLGLDPARVIDTPAGRPVAMTDGGKPL